MTSADNPPVIDEDRELRVAVILTVVVLVTLTVVKPLGGIAVVGAIAFTIAAVMQLYLPLRRADKLGLGNDFVGLHFRAWRRDLKFVAILMAISYPPFILLHYLYMVKCHGWAVDLGFLELARYLPQQRLILHFPGDFSALGASSLWLLEMIATHGLGVALPEETFYRGYLQPRLEKLWAPKHTLFGVRIGMAAVLASFLFALGHFLGEWNPLRLGPFLPGLVFAWQRNATGSVVGAITFHAACNLLSEILSTQYGP